MFVGEMENVNSKPNVVEIWVVFDVLCNTTIIVEDYVVGHEPAPVSSLYHLHNCSY